MSNSTAAATGVRSDDHTNSPKNSDNDRENGDGNDNHEDDRNNVRTESTDWDTLKRLPGKCDLCQKKDGFQSHNLQTCIDCKVNVHETCYGLVHSYGRKRANWKCFACAAVGTQVLVSKSHEVPPVYITQNERPQECALCCIKTGIHAMHPLYDAHGPEGRQVVLHANGHRGLEKRLAWVHSLCGYFVGAFSMTRGCVYGCTEDGTFEGIGDEDQESEYNSMSEGSNDGKLGDGKVSKGGEQSVGVENQEKGDSDIISVSSTSSEEASNPDDNTSSEELQRTKDAEKGGKNEMSTSSVATRRSADSLHNAGSGNDRPTSPIVHNAGSGNERPTSPIGSEMSQSLSDEGSARSDSEFQSNHHFVIAYKEDGVETSWTRVIKENRKTLKCIYCGNKDDYAGCRRIPLQCSAGDMNEFAEFRDCHSSLFGSACTVGLHVGCARWSSDPPRPYQRVFFYPGQQKNIGGLFSEPVCDIYCDAHALDVYRRKGAKPRKKSLLTIKHAEESDYVPSDERREHDGLSQKKDRKRKTGFVEAESSKVTKTTAKTSSDVMEAKSEAAATYLQKKQHLDQMHMDMKADFIKRINRVKVAKDMVLPQEMKRAQAFWKEHMGLTKKEYRNLFARVRAELYEEKYLPFVGASDVVLQGDRGGHDEGEKTAASDAVKLQGSGVGGRRDEGRTATRATVDLKRDGIGGSVADFGYQGTAATVESDQVTEAPDDWKNNPWASLWMPDYEGKAFEFDEWDSIKEIDPPSTTYSHRA